MSVAKKPVPFTQADSQAWGVFLKLVDANSNPTELAETAYRISGGFLDVKASRDADAAALEEAAKLASAVKLDEAKAKPESKPEPQADGAE